MHRVVVRETIRGVDVKSRLKLFAYAGCCFIKYATSEEADTAIRALHNQHTLPGVSFLAGVIFNPVGKLIYW